ncbi:hypothetical protein [Nocardiopsis sp. CC223A]|uniref:hypothetical protein n=1 Tax=Nocardiopsis sp. CC223A TaxID=3044051 RepID=UPI0027961C05|nr:hypothetical protein [Nocardiopsis sp. CC223A]
MAKRVSDHDVDEDALRVGGPGRAAAGPTGVPAPLQRSRERTGVGRAVRTLPPVDQRSGFDRPGRARPDPLAADGERRRPFGFCENGAKAVAEEATTRRAGPDLFARHPVAEPAERTDCRLGS